MLVQYLESGQYRLSDGRDYDPEGLLAQIGPGQALSLVLPAIHTSLLSVPVGRKEIPHLARTLPWSLEEQLSVAPESLQIAHGQVKDGRALVVCVDRHFLQQVLNECESVGLQVDGMFSQLELLPWQPGTWSLCFLDDEFTRIAIRYGHGEGLVCDVGNLAAVLLMLEKEQMPSRIACHLHGVNLPADFVRLFPASLATLLQVEAAVSPLSQSLRPEQLCNLRQGDFARPLPWGQWWQQWRWVAMLAGLLFVSDFTATRIETGRLQRMLESVQAEVSTEFNQAMPGATVVDPLLQLQRSVAALEGSDREGLLTLLTRMAPVLALPEGSIQTLSYNGVTGELQLVLLTDGFASAERFRSGLEALGLQAELLGSTSDANGNRARLRVGV